MRPEGTGECGFPEKHRALENELIAVGSLDEAMA
jgi:hypothetical protein